MRHPSHRGVTLVELMITVVIVGILAAVAIPHYTRYVLRGNRAAAQQHLVDLAQREQQFMADLDCGQNQFGDESYRRLISGQVLIPLLDCK